MQVARLILDYIRALIWPVVIVGGVWVFRSQLRTLLGKVGSLFDRARVQRVKTPGGFEFIFDALEAAKSVVQESVEETAAEVAKAEGPDERERAVEKLHREAAALGRVEAAQESFFRPLDTPLAVGELDPRVEAYVRRVRSAARQLFPRDKEDWSDSIEDALRRHIGALEREGIPVEDTLARLGSPEHYANRWFEGWRKGYSV